MRNEVWNIFQESKKAICIDFTGVSIVSSSFADEFVGKLLIKVGFLSFSQIFTLKNVNEVIAPILNRSVYQRICEEFQNTSPKENISSQDELHPCGIFPSEDEYIKLMQNCKGNQ